MECGSEICAAAVSQGVDGFFENNRIDLNTYLVDALGTLQWRLDTTDVRFESWQARGFDLQGSVVPISP